MKHHASPQRAYRMDARPRESELAFQVVVEETDLWITAQKDLSPEVHSAVHRLRGMVKNALALYADFGPSLRPVPVPDSAPALIREMAEAAQAWNVGPMACVAGAIAQGVADSCQPHSPELLVENGGDLYLHSTRERTIGLLAQPDQGLRLGLRLNATDFPCALCASSGRIGHSLSLGFGDLVVVRARQGAFADAGATALANLLHRRQDVQRVQDQAKEMAAQGLQGVFAQYDDQIGVWGQMELVEVG